MSKRMGARTGEAGPPPRWGDVPGSAAASSAAAGPADGSGGQTSDEGVDGGPVLDVGPLGAAPQVVAHAGDRRRLAHDLHRGEAGGPAEAGERLLRRRVPVPEVGPAELVTRVEGQ